MPVHVLLSAMDVRDMEPEKKRKQNSAIALYGCRVL